MENRRAQAPADMRPPAHVMKPRQSGLRMRRVDDINANNDADEEATPTTEVFRIVQVTDTHVAEDEEDDERTFTLLSKLIEAELERDVNGGEGVDHVVLSGDLITAAEIGTNATDYWEQLVAEFDAYSPSHSAILGNHDAEPPLELHRKQTEKGAATSRRQLMINDARLPLSFSGVAPATLGDAASVYMLPVFSADGRTPQLLMYHLDSGGGGTEEIVKAPQLDWLRTVSQKARYRYGRDIPSVAFIHIPLHQFQVKAANDNVFVGDCLEDVLTTSSDTGLFDVLAGIRGMQAIFSGHNHCNSYCTTLATGHEPASTISLCYGRHSGFGGWSCDDFARGIRVISFSEDQADGELVGETYIRLEDGSVVDRIHLGVPIVANASDARLTASANASIGASLWLFFIFMAAATAISLCWIYIRPRHPGLRRRKNSSGSSLSGWRALPLVRAGGTGGMSPPRSGYDDNDMLGVQMSIVY